MGPDGYPKAKDQKESSMPHFPCESRQEGQRWLRRPRRHRSPGARQSRRPSVSKRSRRPSRHQRAEFAASQGIGHANVCKGLDLKRRTAKGRLATTPQTGPVGPSSHQRSQSTPRTAKEAEAETRGVRAAKKPQNAVSPVGTGRKAAGRKLKERPRSPSRG